MTLRTFRQKVARAAAFVFFLMLVALPIPLPPVLRRMLERRKPADAAQVMKNDG